jgi:hypothetical protein
VAGASHWVVFELIVQFDARVHVIARRRINRHTPWRSRQRPLAKKTACTARSSTLNTGSTRLQVHTFSFTRQLFPTFGMVSIMAIATQPTPRASKSSIKGVTGAPHWPGNAGRPMTVPVESPRFFRYRSERRYKRLLSRPLPAARRSTRLPFRATNIGARMEAVVITC